MGEDMDQELAGNIIVGLRPNGVLSLVLSLDSVQLFDGVRLGIGVNDVVMHRAHQHQVVKAISLFVGLVRVVAGTFGAAGLDVTDTARDLTAAGVNERQGTIREHALVSRDGEEPFDGRCGWYGHPLFPILPQSRSP